MTKQEMIARIDAELARLAQLNPLERAQLDKMLARAHAARKANDLTNKVLGK